MAVKVLLDRKTKMKLSSSKVINIEHYWLSMQVHVNSIYDAGLDRMNVKAHGVKQVSRGLGLKRSTTTYRRC